MLKEIIYTGMGASVLLRNKLEDEVRTLRKNGKLKKKDAKSFLKNLENTGKMEDKRIKKHFKKLVKESINELGLVTKEDFQKLKDEIKSGKISEEQNEKKHEDTSLAQENEETKASKN